MSTRLLDQVSAREVQLAAPLLVFIQDRYLFDETIPMMNPIGVILKSLGHHLVRDESAPVDQSKTNARDAFR